MNEREIAPGRDGGPEGTTRLRSNDENDKPDSGSGGGGGKSKAHRGKERSFWRELPILIIVALGLALLIKTFLIQAFYIPSESMENTLVPNDRVLVNKLAYRLGDVQRGDVIVFNGADSWQEITIPEPENAVSGVLRKAGELFGFAPIGEKDFIKRVIGLPGDKVKCCDAKGRITVNGKPLAEKDYIYPGDSPSLQDFTITVPEGRLWVMGDHRSASADSRAHLTDAGQGTIPIDHVVGRAFVVVWPLNRLAVLSRPGAFAEAGLAMGPSDAVPLAAAGIGLPLTAAFAMHRWRSRQPRQPWRRRARRRG
jgi:signal peptidase I